jgi:hypothetical protein
VPLSSIINPPAGGVPSVLTIDDAGRIHKQPVSLGLQDANLSEVLSGLDNGQMVATSSLTNLNEGDIVRPQVTPTTALAAPATN